MSSSPLSTSAFARTPLLFASLVLACAAPREGTDHESNVPPRSTPVTPVATAAAPAATPGAPGIGDPLFPTAGNGGYDVQSYDLTIALDRTDGPIDASTTIRAKSTQALSRFDLDLHGLDVHSIDVDGRAASFARDGDELVITPARSIANATEFTTIVKYGGIPEGVVDPSFPIDMKLGWIAKNGEVYVLSEPTGANSFFPCNDHPRDKALFTIRVTVPKPLQVISAGALAETVDRGDTRTFVYKPRDPMATYLLTIAIGEFDESASDGPHGLPIRNYFSRHTSERERKDFDRTGAIIQFLEDTFGPYPFETCGNILASIELPGALETQTLPTYGKDAGSGSTICHELAHEWFGDCVSVENWQDIWLNEGFAEYAAWMYLESTKGRDVMEKHARGQYGFYRSIQHRPSEPAREGAPTPASGAASTDDHAEPAQPTPGKPTVRSLFGTTVYVRGPLVLHALRTEIGDATFLALMRSWVEKHKNGNASVEDFLAHVEHTASKEARTLVEHWVYDGEMPHVASWDEALAKDKAERDARRKALQEKKDAPPGKTEGGEKKGGD